MASTKPSAVEDSFKQQLARATASVSGVSKSLNAETAWTACLRHLDVDTQIIADNASDNPLVLQFLVQAYQQPLAEDFQNRLDEPLYVPTDRLLLRRSDQIIGLVQVSKLIGWFHGQRCPIARLQDFVTLPEFRSNAYDTALLEVAEADAVNGGAILGFVRTDRPEWFEQEGWSCCRGQGHTRANTGRSSRILMLSARSVATVVRASKCAHGVTSSSIAS